LTNLSLAADIVADWPISTIGASDQGQITDPVGGNDSISFGNWRNQVGPADATLGVPMDGVALIMNQWTTANFGEGSNYAITNTIGYGSFTLFYRFAMTTGGWFDITKGNAFKISTTGNWDNYSWVEVLVNGNNIAHGPAFTTAWSLSSDKAVWHDVVVVCNMETVGSSHLTLYFDGIQVDNWDTSIVDLYNNDSFIVKRHDIGGTQNSYLEAMRLYSGALTTSEVKALSLPMIVTPESSKLSNQAGQLTLTVAKTNSSAILNWTATVVEGTSWLTITNGSSGTDNGTISVSYTANEDLINTRTGKIRVTTSAGFSQDIAVTQGISLVANWKMNEGSGLTLADSSGNGNTAYAAWSTKGWDTTIIPAKTGIGAPSDGKAISLQTEEYITLSSGSNTLVNDTFAGSFTIFFRFANQFGGWFDVVKGNLSISNNGNWSGSNWIGVNVNGDCIANGVDAFVDGTVMDIALTWDATTRSMGLYLNGIFKQAWTEAAADLTFVNTSPFLIQRWNTAGSNVAWIESARLYNVALTSGQVRALSAAMTLGVTPESQSVSSDAGVVAFDVANADGGAMDWTAEVISGGDWLTLTSGASGAGDGIIMASFTQNTSTTTDRTATIRITAPGAASSPKDVTVIQAKVAQQTKIPGDANGDNMVDVGDLGILAANYGGSGKGWSQGDFNGDGLVDVGDLGILAAHYGENANQSVDFAADYAKAFGTTVTDENSDEEGTSGSVCSMLGLPLIAGLALMGLMLVKLEE
jgi:hypothetical protein